MTNKLMAFALLLGGLIACGEDEKGGDSANGESVYNTNCASCHGSAGAGGIGPALPGSLDDEAISDIIENGQGTGMPAGLISGSDVDDVVAYLNTL